MLPASRIWSTISPCTKFVIECKIPHQEPSDVRRRVSPGTGVTADCRFDCTYVAHILFIGNFKGGWRRKKKLGAMGGNVELSYTDWNIDRTYGYIRWIKWRQVKKPQPELVPVPASANQTRIRNRCFTWRILLAAIVRAASALIILASWRHWTG